MRLTKDQIREIVLAYKGGESQASVARRYQIDDSTVRYHVEKYDGSYIQGLGLYSLIKAEAQYECIHPSVSCHVCGKLHDTILRAERIKIIQLERELARYRPDAESGEVQLEV